MVGITLVFLRFAGGEKAPPEVVERLDGMNLMTTRHRGSAAPLGKIMARDGTIGDLTFFQGKVVLLYIWSPRVTVSSIIEFEGLAKLQAKINSPDLAMVAVAVGQDGWPGVESFGRLYPITIPAFIDAAGPNNSVFKLFPLPTTLLIDRKGYEIARLPGAAGLWDSPRAVEVIKAALENRL